MKTKISRKAKSSRKIDDIESKEIEKKEMEKKLPDDGEITQHEIDGEILRFKWENGKPLLVEKVSVIKSKKVPVRHFKLRAISREFKGQIVRKTHTINTGEGRKNLRFFQGNFEGGKYDPKLENVVSVDDEDLVRGISSQVDLFEEVYK